MVVIAVTLAAWLAGAGLQASSAMAAEPPLLFENGNPSQYRFEDGVLSLRSGSGWIRTRQVVGDFVLTMEFLLQDADSEAGIGIRALTVGDRWPKKGYRLVLSARDGGSIDARKRPSVVLGTPVGPLAAGTWHQLVLTGQDARLTVSIDGAPPSVATIDDFVGTLLFDVKRGAAEFRKINVRELPVAGAYDLTDDDGKKEAKPAELTNPRLVKEVRPSYTYDAMRRKVQGVVELRVIIRDDGRVGLVKLVTALDPDLEQAAVVAVSQWRFKPATFRGSPVACWASVELTFTLK